MAAKPGSRVPAPPSVPKPPTPFGLVPLLTPWPAARRLHRVYNIAWDSREFYPGDSAHRGRFHPFAPGRRRTQLPVLYGASDLDGALSESVFHDIPIKSVKRVGHSKLLHRVAIELVAERDLTLVDLTTPGLRRLNLTRTELIESDPRSYADTARWARTLHDHVSEADGLLWMSRQHDSSQCVVLFGDRVSPHDLSVPQDSMPLVLSIGAGLDAVCAAATRAGITVTGLV